MYDSESKAPDALDQTSAQAEQSEQTSDNKAEVESVKKVNWQDDPEYRKQQAKATSERTRLEQENARVKQEAEATRKRLEALEDQAYGKDDYGKMQLFAQRQAQEAETLRQELAAVKAERETDNAKSNTLKEIADAFEVPVSVLADATDPKHAVLLARTERDRRIKVRLKEETETRTANKPDLGGGARSTATTRLDSEYDDAAKRGDSVAMARLLREIRAKK